jgi:hypothetical protein
VGKVEGWMRDLGLIRYTGGDPSTLKCSLFLIVTFLQLAIGD